MSIPSDSQSEQSSQLASAPLTPEAFAQEVSDWIQQIGIDLLTLRPDHGVLKCDRILKAAHGIKTKAASAQFTELETLAYLLESAFRAFYHQGADLDRDLETLLRDVYFGLRLPLMEQIRTGTYNATIAQETAATLFAQLKHRFGDAIERVADLPTEWAIRSAKRQHAIASETALHTGQKLSIAGLFVCRSQAAIVTLPRTNLLEILMPARRLIKQIEGQRFVYWRSQMLPIHQLSTLLPSRLIDAPITQPIVKDLYSVFEEIDDPIELPIESNIDLRPAHRFPLSILVVQRENRSIAIELRIDRLITASELVFQPIESEFSYVQGYAIVDQTQSPVIDINALLFTIDNAPLPALPPAIDRNELPIEELIEIEGLEPISSIESPSPTILIVDDSPTVRRVLSFNLQQAGYHVLQAEDGKQAIEVLDENPDLNLIVCDIEMPNMNGFDFLTFCRRDLEWSELPVVMLSSRNDLRSRNLAVQLGATAYFTKPYIKEELLSALAKILEPQ